MLNLGEKLMLLALHDEKGTVLSSASMSLEYGLSGAVLMELVLRGRLRADKKNLVIVDAALTGDDILDEALTKIKQSKRDRNTKYWVDKLSRGIKDLKGRLLDRLIDKGILRTEKRRILGVISSQRYPMEDAKAEQEVRDRIRAVILGGATLDPRIAMLISLVNACGLVDEIFSREERKLARKRIKEIAKKDLIGKTVSDTVAEIEAAIVASIVVSTGATSLSSS
jgi:hypothetical protein